MPKRSETYRSHPLRGRVNGRTPRGRRIRRLFTGYMKGLDPNDVVATSSALRAAELATTSEDVRSRVMAGELELSDTLVRVSNLLDRAERRLATLAGLAPDDDEDEQLREWSRAAKPAMTDEENDALDPVKIYAKAKREREAREAKERGDAQ
jgi:hypothetical protein